MKAKFPTSKKQLVPSALLPEWKAAAETNKMLNYTSRAPNFCRIQKVETETVNNYSRLYGIELEVERRSNTPTDIIKRVYESMPGCVIVKSDSSLSNGFEIVSAPATLEAHRVFWQNFFISNTDEKAPASHLKSFDTTTCGMHIHISRASLNPVLLYNFWNFFNKHNHDEYISRIAGRGRNSYSAPVESASFLDTISRNSQRYHYVNLSNTATVEVRIFRGNTDYIGFFKNLDFLDSLLKLLVINPKANGHDYIKYVLANKQDYPYMHMWLRKHKVDLEAVVPSEIPPKGKKPLGTKVDPSIFKFPGEE
tara:strand:- start:189 stop:1115 length:927 start_codon:yes stop_codon:yes gene_type:complete